MIEFKNNRMILGECQIEKQNNKLVVSRHGLMLMEKQFSLVNLMAVIRTVKEELI